MDQYICTCAIKIGDEDLDEKIGFGFERLELGYKRREPLYKITGVNNMFDGIVGLVNLFNILVRYKLEDDEKDRIDYFLQNANHGIMTEIEIGDDYDYDDIYLNVSIDRLDKFFDKNGLKSDSYLGYLNVNFDSSEEEKVIDYVIYNELGHFDEWDVESGYVQLKKVADGVWVVQVDHA